MKTCEQIRNPLPGTERVEIHPDYFLEVLHLEGPSPTIVFVHGGGGNLWNPYRQLDQFKDRYSLLTYNLSGYGESSYSRDHRLQDHVDDLRALVQTYDLNPVVIHGHSYGTEIAIEYAKLYSPLGLILVGGGAYELTPWWEKPFLQLMLAMRLYKFPMEWIARLLANQALHPGTPKKRVSDFLQCNPIPKRRSAWETIVKSFWNYSAQELGMIDTPTLVLHGPADGVVPIEAARRTAEEIPGANFRSIPRTGHVPMVERPGTYNRLFEDFLEGVKK